MLKIIGLSLVLGLLAGSALAHKTQKPVPARILSSANTIWADLSPRSKDRPATAIVAIKPRDEMPTWFLSEGGELRALQELPTMSIVYFLKASPDHKWLAVGSAGEGHPSIDLFKVSDLENSVGQRDAGENLSESTKVKAAQTVDPYPGVVNPVEWRGNRLILMSDLLLTHRSKKDDGTYRVPGELDLGEQLKFSLDPESGEIEAVSPQLKDSFAYFEKKLSRAKNRDDAQMAASAMRRLDDARAESALKKYEKKLAPGRIDSK